jgi:hypothetical protein
VTKAKKKAARAKKSTPKNPVNETVNVPEIRERVRQLIAAKVEKMVDANAEEAGKGHLAQLKFLFEVLGLYPGTGQEEPETEDSNDLARVLLNRFEFPNPAPTDEESGEAEQAAVGAEVAGDSVE